jgi:hypothetical protein
MPPAPLTRRIHDPRLSIHNLHLLFIGRESVVSAYLTTSHAVLSLLLLLVIIIQVLLCPSYGEEQKLKGEVKRLLDPSYRPTPCRALHSRRARRRDLDRLLGQRPGDAYMALFSTIWRPSW